MEEKRQSTGLGLRGGGERFLCSKARLAFSETSDISGVLEIGQSWSLDQDT